MRGLRTALCLIVAMGLAAAICPVAAAAPAGVLNDTWFKVTIKYQGMQGPAADLDGQPAIPGKLNTSVYLNLFGTSNNYTYFVWSETNPDFWAIIGSGDVILYGSNEAMGYTMEVGFAHNLADLATVKAGWFTANPRFMIRRDGAGALRSAKFKGQGVSTGAVYVNGNTHVGAGSALISGKTVKPAALPFPPP